VKHEDDVKRYEYAIEQLKIKRDKLESELKSVELAIIKHYDCIRLIQGRMGFIRTPSGRG
jgi:hypothetical protein